METWELVCCSLFLLIAAEPVVMTFKGLVRHIRSYRKKEEDAQRTALRKQIAAYGVGVAVLFAIYVFIVAIFV